MRRARRLVLVLSGLTCTLAPACGQDQAAPPPPPLPMICVSPLTATPWPGDDSCPAPVPAAADGFDAALQVAGLRRCDVKIPPATAALSGFPDPDKGRLPDYDALHLGPLRLPGWARQTAAWLDQGLDGASEGPVARALMVAALRHGRSQAATSACLDLAPYAATQQAESPLARAVATLRAAHGQGQGQGTTAAAAELAALGAQLQGVPLPVQRALVPIVAALDHAATVVTAARGTADPDVLDWLATSAPRLLLSSNTLTDERVKQLRAVDVAAMADAAALIALSVHRAALPSLPPTDFPEVAIDTPLGKIVLRGGGNDTYDMSSPAAAAALLVDLGGDDTYEVPAGAATLDLPVQVLIDAGGADRYRYAAHPGPRDRPPRLPSDGSGRAADGQTASRTGRQGSGLLGIGMLFDLGPGADSYRSLALSQGSAFLGVGVLYDEGGDDDYRAEVFSQGAAAWGIGLLLDRSGKDAYRSYSYSQGFGYSGGVGALVDGTGDDLYFVDPGDPMVKADPELPGVGGDPLYPSAQLPGNGNNSMSQGCGFGRRADGLPDMTFLSGGHGLLYDRSGNDRYLASVFAQGTGYYRGVGVLLDGGGDDTYEGLWYVQGAAAHVAIGALLDLSGNDRYDPTFPIRATSIGTSNDFSVGLHLDLGGDDSYVAPGLSLGSGYAQGFGILVNTGGTDRFQAAGYPTLGGATISTEFPYTIPRARAMTLGLFAHLGGDGTYVVPRDGMFVLPAGKDRTWSYAQVAMSKPDGSVPPSEKSAGLDMSSGGATLP